MAKGKQKLNLQMNRKNLLIFAAVVVAVVAGYFLFYSGGMGQALRPAAGTESTLLQPGGISNPEMVVAFVNYYEIPVVRAARAAPMPAPPPNEWMTHYGVCFRGKCYGWIEVRDAYLGSKGWTAADLSDPTKSSILIAELLPAIEAGLDNGILKFCSGSEAYCSFCEDTDGGGEDQKYKFGKCSDGKTSQEFEGKTKSDSCDYFGNVDEWYCGDNMQCLHKDESCSTRGCEDGACVKPCTKHEDCFPYGRVCKINSTPKYCVSCYESDGGVDYETPGTVAYYFNNKLYEFRDYCIEESSDESLMEYFCLTEGTSASQPYGFKDTSCQPNICANSEYGYGGYCDRDSSGNGTGGETGTCDDSADGGRVPGKPGITDTAERNWADYCVGSGSVHEYWCEGGNLKQETLTCSPNVICCKMEITGGDYDGYKTDACACAE